MSLPGPPAIDYTSRDYESIRNDLLTLKGILMPEWSSQSPNDFGVVLIELFSYLGDQLHYYADRVATEAYIDTATQRSNVIRLARMLGYTPTNHVAALATLTLTNSTASPVVVPALTVVATTFDTVSQTSVQFETDSTVTVPANSATTVTAHQGKTVSNEAVATSDGSEIQTYALFNTSVIDGSVSISVSGTKWNYVTRLITANPFDQVFTLLTDENDVTYVQFGDGTNGQIPPNGSAILATYRVGGGVVGNVAAGTLTTIAVAGITSTNTSSASGGADPESTDTIRANAVNSVRALGRAVTLDDYASLAVTVSQCGRASAASSVYNSVTVYVAPTGGGGYDGTGGTTGNATLVLTSLISAVQTYLNSVKPATATVTVLGPTYVPVNVSVNLHLSDQQSQTQAIAAATASLQGLLSFDGVIFGDQITPNDIYLALQGISGVLYPDLNVLSTSSSGVGVVTMASNQIPTVGTITVTATGGTP